MSDIVISGYYGFKNTGDELILKAIVNDLRFYKPGIKITVLSATPKETAITYNLRSINRWNLFTILKEIKNCKMLVSGAGGLFQDTTGSLSLWYYLLIIFIAAIFKKTVFVYAVGIGEIRHLFNRYFIKNCFNKVNRITVRTRQDKEMLESFGVRKEITITADPVFGLDLEPYKKNNNIQNNQIGVIIRKTGNWKKDIKIFSELSRLFMENTGTKIIFIPFQKTSDLKILRMIQNEIAQKTEIFIWEEIDDILKLFSRLDVIVSMRLHGLILASKYGIPFVPISRYSKITNFLSLIGYENSAKINEFTSGDIYKYTLNEISGKKNGINKTFEILEDLKNKAKKTAELCISELERNKLS
ncbi:MAG: polysaccharide pyruvyl transferase CsaB [Elusimicrobia bacterium]|nr:polysaccharide pyruvyl transferase CsaB [Elusimicrobiota bacterium]